MRRFLLVTFALLAVGCSSSKHRVHFRIGPDSHRDVVVLGAKPWVEVENHGPGRVAILFPGQERVMLGTAATGATVSGPARVRVTAAGAGGAEVTVTATGGDGLSLGATTKKR